TLTVLPNTNQFGSTTITVSASDGQATASRTFTLTVNAVNDAPEISPFADITLDKNASTGPIPFTVTDVDSPLASLVVTAVSTNQALVTNSAITLGGS